MFLLSVNIYNTELQTESYVKLSFQKDHRRILSMFRCGNLPLPIETVRFVRPKLPVEHCEDIVEYDYHFYDAIRQNMFHKAQLCNRDLILNNSSKK